MATIPVKWYVSEMTGSPRISGTTGDMITFLDTVLTTTGFNTLSASSLVINNNVATLTFASPHGYLDHQVIAISGSTITGDDPTALNGQWRATVPSISNPTTLTFATSGISNQTASGSISVKTPGLGWTKAYSGTNLGAYQSSDNNSTKMLLRVSDSDYRATVLLYESMTDINTGWTTCSSGLTWQKSNYANTNACVWALVGDTRFFMLFIAPLTQAGYTRNYEGSGFGDLVPFSASDNWHCVLFSRNSNFNIGSYNVDIFTNPRGGGNSGSGGNGSTFLIARGPYGLGSCASAYAFSDVSGNAGASGWTFPSPLDGKLHIVPRWVYDGSGVRGILPGVYMPVEHLAGYGSNCRSRTFFRYNGRVYMPMNNYGSPPSNDYICILVDITGPWRT